MLCFLGSDKSFTSSRSGSKDSVTDLEQGDVFWPAMSRWPQNHRAGISWVLLNPASVQKLPMINFLTLCLDLFQYLRNKGDHELKQKKLNVEGLEFGRELNLFKWEMQKLSKIYPMNYWKLSMKPQIWVNNHLTNSYQEYEKKTPRENKRGMARK